MSKDQKQVCMFCKFWNCNYRNVPENLMTDTNGDCRFSHPRLMSIGSNTEGKEVVTRWPRTRGGDWCGRYAERRDDHVADLPSTWQHISEPTAEVIRKSAEAYGRNSRDDAA
jgi:hypothetical protein